MGQNPVFEATVCSLKMGMAVAPFFSGSIFLYTVFPHSIYTTPKGKSE